MPNYRLYRLDGAGKISTAEWIEAASDDDACREARALVGTPRFELWDKNRLVQGSAGNSATLDGRNKPTAS